jgi:hypothetical protein
MSAVMAGNSPAAVPAVGLPGAGRHKPSGPYQSWIAIDDARLARQTEAVPEKEI